MAINLKTVDVAVIGLGAAGGVAVLPLTTAGLSVAGIEAGTWMDPSSFKPDEIHNNVRALVTSVPKAAREMPTLRNSPSQPTRRGTVHPMMNAIGGTSIHYWGQSWRLKPWDFKTRTAVVRRYGANAIPKGSTLEDWPIDYDDLEPYYDKIEHEVGVSGKAGNIQGKLDPSGNVFEAPRQREYPMPPLRSSGYTDLMEAAARKLGWKPFHPPAAINSQPYRGRPGCAYHGYCSRGGCHISAKNSTAVTTIPEAMKTRNLTIFDRAQVTRIETGADGRASGVRYIRDRKEYFQPAKVVLLASYTYENARLLLLSRSKAHPQGLSNRNGQVGRHYFGHWQTGPVLALFPFDINIWYGTPAQGIAVDDWSDDNYDHAGLGFVGGSSLHAYHEMHPIQAASMDTFGMAPAWGSRWKGFIRDNAARWATSYIQTSTFPYEDNFLDLDPVAKDPLGDPVCRVTSCARDNERMATEYSQSKMDEWFRAAGAIRTIKVPGAPPGLSTHAYGGTRMGENPATNVVDRWGFSHEVPNLGVLGSVGDGDQRRSESDTDRSGSVVAHGGSFDEQLESDRRLIDASPEPDWRTLRSRRQRAFVPITLLLIFLPSLRAQTCLPGEVRVVVIDSQESPVFNALVSLTSSSAQPASRSTQTSGLADFLGLACGAWNISVEAESFGVTSRTVEIESASNLEVRIVLTPKIRVESVEVKETAPTIEQSSSQNYELKPAEVKKLPSNPATVNDTLPLVPGVVRDQKGELKIDGSGQERSAMVVNQADITDPATGRFGQSIPLDSIETVNVLQTPFLAQYGRFTQSVVAVETKRGGDKWHADLNDPFPDFRIRSYHMRGIRDENPRFVTDGPLIKDRLFFISALQYSFYRDSVRTLPFPSNESRRESVNSFSQLDWVITPGQFVTATMHVSPQHTNFVNPDYFNPQPVTPSYSQHNYAGTLTDHFGILRGILDSSISVQRFDVNVGAQGAGDMIVTPTGNRGNYFGAQNRDARRQEWLETWSLAPVEFLGAHLFKLGSSLTGSSNAGQFTYHSVDILNAEGVRTQRIDFTNQLPFNRTDLEVTAYAQDHWSPIKKVSFDYGARVEHQRLATSLRIAPRGGVAWSPFADQRTVLRAGYGLFYDHLPLDIYTFGRYPLRTITNYAADGSIIGSPIPFVNVIGSVTGPRSFFINGQQVAGAFSPRGAALSLQAEHSFSAHFRIRAVYTDSQSVGLIVFEPTAPEPSPEIVLNGDGKSRYQQAELTARFSWKDDQQLVFSYTRSRARGNLNTFDSFLGNFPTLIVRPNLSSNLPADLPNRFLIWGTLNTRVWRLQVSPMIEYHTGFPYAQLDAAQNYVGVPYRDSTRFPRFFQADARVSRDFKVNPKYAVRLSLTVTNITNHFNALQIHNNTADPLSGLFFGDYDRRYRGDFDIIF